MSGLRRMTKDEELTRREALLKVQELFPNTLEGFLMFAQTCISELITGNPDLNRVQADICKYLFEGNKLRMIQAQRGQAKTTLTAIFAVFKLLHEPNMRILIVSAGGNMSKEIASFVIQILNGLDFLWMLCADKNAGDHASVEWYDIHWLFKGVEKSPSVKCLGVGASIQGSRADLIIADDIESMKNSRTVTTREVLEDLTTEFESVCSKGEIIYLGTPQSTQSIYNNLPARGYEIRIWSGRYPTMKEMENYDNYLAPMLLKDIELNPELQSGGGLLGDKGQPVCPEMFDNQTLIEKEISQGEAKFQLQFMLSTALMDKERYPLKVSNLIVSSFNAVQGCVMPIGSMDDRNRFIASCAKKHKLYWAMVHDYEIRPFEKTIMYIDPAGGGKNSDETGYAIIKILGSYIYLYKVGGMAGGFEDDKLKQMVAIAKEAQVNTVVIEKNFGYGAYMAMVRPHFNNYAEGGFPVDLEEDFVTGQKELRIIDVLEPVLSSGRMVIHPEVIRDDWDSTERYPTEKRVTYSLIHQMAMITRDRGCLPHDDRLDALSGAVRWVVAELDFDTRTIMDAKKMVEAVALINGWKDPVSRRKWLTGINVGGQQNVLGSKGGSTKALNVFGR